MFLVRLLVVVLPLLTLAQSVKDCNCRYHKGGCAIDVPAPVGFKCKCHYLDFWTCSGSNFICRDDEWCPGGRYSYCACVQGRGDCGAYKLRSSTKGSCSEANKAKANSIMQPHFYKDCNCRWAGKGCMINKPAPEGFKCVCRNTFLFTCDGWTQGCDEDEYCPADDSSYCGCKRGQGNCGGYPKEDRQKVCSFRRPDPLSCNCTQKNLWTEGQYSVANVSFNMAKAVRGHPEPVQVGTGLDVPNASDVEQSQQLTEVLTTTSESWFEKSHGVTVTAGISVTATTPFVSGTAKIDTSDEYNYKFGEKKIDSRQSRHAFTCSSPPKTITRCKIFLTRHSLTVPYTMDLKHKIIPDCVCKSYGIFRVKGSFNSEMSSQSIGSCHTIDLHGVCYERLG